MELKRHFDLRYIFVGLYVLLFVTYIIVGLQPAEAAANYEISANLSIPAIGLRSDVTELTLRDGNLDTPDTIVGSYSRADNKTLLIGHSTTIFERLNEIRLGDTIEYDNASYTVISYKIQAKPDISMAHLLKRADEDTIVLMTCAGELLENGDATHRLIITAVNN